MKQLKYLATFLFFISIPSLSLSQDCGCDHILSGNNSGVNIINASDFDYSPGDVFCINGGSYSAFRLFDFIGTKDNPIIIKNCDGQAQFTSPTYTALSFRNSKYVHLTGTGDDNHQYGIQILSTKSGTSGVAVAALSSDFEIDHLEITNTGFAGIIAKTDPKCDDPSTLRENFIMEDLIIHDNYIHETGGEGMYLGATFGYATSSLECDGVQKFAHLIRGLRVYDNIIENTGWDGLQVSLAAEDAKVYDNFIDGYGAERVNNQNFGLAVAGSQIEVYNNQILQKTEFHGPDVNPLLQRGISIIDAITGSKFYNNIIYNSSGNGIWMHIRMATASLGDVNEAYYFVNNTIIEPGGSGIFYNTSLPGGGGSRPEINNRFYNNLVVDPGNNYENSGFWKTADEAFIDFNVKSQRDQSTKSNNYFTRTISEVNFVNAGANNFDLLEGSPAINTGIDVSDLNINIDFNSNPRPVGPAYDIGAFEYGTSSGTNVSPNADAGGNKSGFINESIQLDGSNSSDADGNIVSYLWEQTAGNTVAITNSDQGIASFISNEVGIYKFRLTITDNGGLIDSDEVDISITEESNQLPVADAGADATSLAGVNVQLNGSASNDPDGQIVTYLWEQIAGETIPIISSDLAIATIEEPIAGVYTFRLTVTDDQGALDSDEVTYTISENVTSLGDSFNDQMFKVFPNPSNGKFAVLINSGFSEKISISIYSILGRLIHKREESVAAGENNINFDIHNLNLKGNYLLSVQSEGLGDMRKMIFVN